jgi:hypothetical protein
MTRRYGGGAAIAKNEFRVPGSEFAGPTLDPGIQQPASPFDVQRSTFDVRRFGIPDAFALAFA